MEASVLPSRITLACVAILAHHTPELPAATWCPTVAVGVLPSMVKRTLASVQVQKMCVVVALSAVPVIKRAAVDVTVTARSATVPLLKIERGELRTMKENLDPQSVLEKLITEDLEKVDIKVRKLQYKMDFGTTEIVVKMGLN